jgi:hypothetical protein
MKQLIKGGILNRDDNDRRKIFDGICCDYNCKPFFWHA